MKKETIQEFERIVSKYSNFVLATHLNADGDAIGSAVTLCRFLRSRGKKAGLFVREPVQEALRSICMECMPDIFDPSLHGPLVEKTEALLLVDNAVPARFAAMKDYILRSTAFKICIDHHPENNPVWDFNIIDSDTCATAEIVFDLLTGMGERITFSMAEALYVAIVTDTGGFRFSKTNARTHEIAAELVRIGISPQKIYQDIYERTSFEYVKLMGAALESVTRIDDGRIAYITITRDMINRHNAHHIDTSDIINPVLSIENVRIAVLFKELADGRSKVSLRSKGDIDVNLLASEFGGGGHRNASGIVMNEKLDETMKKILDRLRKALFPEL